MPSVTNYGGTLVHMQSTVSKIQDYLSQVMGIQRQLRMLLEVRTDFLCATRLVLLFSILHSRITHVLVYQLRAVPSYRMGRLLCRYGRREVERPSYLLQNLYENCLRESAVLQVSVPQRGCCSCRVGASHHGEEAMDHRWSKVTTTRPWH